MGEQLKRLREYIDKNILSLQELNLELVRNTNTDTESLRLINAKQSCILRSKLVLNNLRIVSHSEYFFDLFALEDFENLIGQILGANGECIKNGWTYENQKVDDLNHFAPLLVFTLEAHKKIKNQTKKLQQSPSVDRLYSVSLFLYSLLIQEIAHRLRVQIENMDYSPAKNSSAEKMLEETEQNFFRTKLGQSQEYIKKFYKSLLKNIKQLGKDDPHFIEQYKSDIEKFVPSDYKDRLINLFEKNLEIESSNKKGLEESQRIIKHYEEEREPYPEEKEVIVRKKKIENKIRRYIGLVKRQYDKYSKKLGITKYRFEDKENKDLKKEGSQISEFLLLLLTVKFIFKYSLKVIHKTKYHKLNEPRIKNIQSTCDQLYDLSKNIGKIDELRDLVNSVLGKLDLNETELVETKNKLEETIKHRNFETKTFFSGLEKETTSKLPTETEVIRAEEVRRDLDWEFSEEENPKEKEFEAKNKAIIEDIHTFLTKEEVREEMEENLEEEEVLTKKWKNSIEKINEGASKKDKNFTVVLKTPIGTTLTEKIRESDIEDLLTGGPTSGEIFLFGDSEETREVERMISEGNKNNNIPMKSENYLKKLKELKSMIGNYGMNMTNKTKTKSLEQEPIIKNILRKTHSQGYQPKSKAISEVFQKMYEIAPKKKTNTTFEYIPAENTKIIYPKESDILTVIPPKRKPFDRTPFGILPWKKDIFGIFTQSSKEVSPKEVIGHVYEQTMPGETVVFCSGQKNKFDFMKLSQTIFVSNKKSDSPDFYIKNLNKQIFRNCVKFDNIVLLGCENPTIKFIRNVSNILRGGGKLYVRGFEVASKLKDEGFEPSQADVEFGNIDVYCFVKIKD